MSDTDTLEKTAADAGPFVLRANNDGADGVTTLDGRLPTNTGGGLIGFGHPVGATGVKQPLEIYRQMKGRCGDYQVPSVPGYGLTSNMGGDDKTVVSLAIRNVG